MAIKILGIDIGTHSIKIALLKKTMRGYEIISLNEKVIPKDYKKDLTIDLQAETLKSLFEENGIEADYIITSFPSQNVFHRIMTLPFTNRDKLEKIIPYEIEDFIPCSAEDIVVDFHPIKKINGKTKVLSVAIEKKLLAKYFDTLRRKNIEPWIVDIDAMALYSLSQLIIKDEKGVFAIIDIGLSKTVIDIVSDGEIQFFRAIHIAGNTILDRIRKEMGINFEKAEDVIVNYTSGNKIQGVKNIILDAVDPLIKEIKKTIHAYTAVENKEVNKIYICGGLSNIEIIEERLRDELELSVNNLKDSLMEMFSNPIFNNGTLHTALGLALRGIRSEKISKINFRKGEFSFIKGLEDIRRKIINTGILVGLILLILIFNLSINLNAKVRRYGEIKDEIRKIYNETLPGEKNIVNEKVQLKGKLEEMKKKYSQLKPTEDASMKIIDILKELTDRMSGDVKIEIHNLSINKGLVSFKGETDSFESIEKIKRLLSGCQKFQNVSISEAKVATEQNRVIFQIDLKLF